MNDKYHCTHRGPGELKVTCPKCRAKIENGHLVYPNKDNILKELDRFATESRPKDVQWIFYAGHGSHSADDSFDEADGQDECIVPADHDNDLSAFRARDKY